LANYSVFRRNIPACPDDGIYAEGYSDAIVRTLATRWKNLGDLQKFFKNDLAFKKFVLSHVDATADSDDLRTVLRNAETKCLRGFSGLCKEIAIRAREALSV
jgi:hypothetical protein